MTIRKPRLCYAWRWDNTLRRYRDYNPKDVISGYLSGNHIIVYPDTSRPLFRLTSVLPHWNKNCHPNNGEKRYRGHSHRYWYEKTHETLTSEDRAFLKWMIRGRINDAPTKDPGIRDFGTETTKSRKKVSPRGLTQKKK